MFLLPVYCYLSYFFLNDHIENRDPEKLDMIAIEGTEILNIRHLGSHFNDYMGEVEPGYEGDKVDYILSQIADREGIAQFFHPGRYTDDDPSEYTPQRGVLV